MNKEEIIYKLERVKLENGQTIAYRKAGRGDVKNLLIHGKQSSSLIY
ncbi:MAG: hypothetical protein SOW41_06350 [Anaerococcus sp.]|nr:hypothetical protein [Peptoniphilaceae bacterium]MDY3055652.1 hypothetical protein [Anaerococcus sp.]